MTHYDNDRQGQIRYLKTCGYTTTYLNKLNRKQLYNLYRKTEQTQPINRKAPTPQFPW